MARLVKTVDFGDVPLISLRATHRSGLVACSYSRDAENRSGSVLLLDEDMNVVYEERLSSASFHMDYLWESDVAVCKLADGRIALFECGSRQLHYEKVDNGGVMVTDVSYDLADRSHVFFTDSNGRLRGADRSTGRLTFDQKAHDMHKSVVSAWTCHHIDAHTVASGGDDCLLKVWDTRTATCATTCRDHQGGVVRVRSDDSSLHLFTGAYDETLRTFDIRCLKQCISSVKLNGDPWDFDVYPDGNIAAATMYGGWCLLSSDLSTSLSQDVMGALLYGIYTHQTGDNLKVVCTSFNNGLVYIYDCETSWSPANCPRDIPNELLRLF